VCENTAVSWSEASAERSRIQVETQQEIARKLLVNIKNLQEAGYPEVFLQGMNRALDLIQHPSVPRVPDNQGRLF
jgi:hypothetical protein